MKKQILIAITVVAFGTVLSQCKTSGADQNSEVQSSYGIEPAEVRNLDLNNHDHKDNDLVDVRCSNGKTATTSYGVLRKIILEGDLNTLSPCSLEGGNVVAKSDCPTDMTFNSMPFAAYSHEGKTEIKQRGNKVCQAQTKGRCSTMIDWTLHTERKVGRTKNVCRQYEMITLKGMSGQNLPPRQGNCIDWEEYTEYSGGNHYFEWIQCE